MISLGDIYSNTESGSVVTLTSNYDTVILRIYDDYSARLDEIVNSQTLGRKLIELKQTEASLLTAFIEIINYYYRTTDSGDTNFFTEDEKDDVLQHINNLLDSIHRIDTAGSGTPSTIIGIPCYSGSLNGVTSIFGRQGSIVAIYGDYNADLIDYDNSISGLSATNVQNAIDELATTVGVSSIWGNITGTLANQSDLQNALDLKQNIITNSDDITEGSTNLFFTAAEESKLAGIEAGAQVNPTASEIKTLYESNPDTNVFTDVNVTKLAGIEIGAEVNNISDADASLLTSGGEISLHTHSYLTLTDTPSIPSSHTELSDIGSNTHNQIDSHIINNSNPHSVTATQIGAVATTGNETVAGIKSFSSFPITPSSSPTTSYQVANKQYVDSVVTTSIPSTGRIIYLVENNGNDANDGLSLAKPKLTIAAAITAANALTPTASDPVWIYSNGNFTSVSTIVFPSYIHFYGPNTNIITNSVNIYNNQLYLNNLTLSTGTIHFYGTDYSTLQTNIFDSSASGVGIICDNNTIVYIKSKKFITSTIYGISLYGFDNQNLTIDIDNIITSADNMYPLYLNPNTTAYIKGNIGSIEDGGAYTNNRALTVFNGATADLNINKIDTNAAYSVGSGSTLNLFINELNGTTSASGTVNITIAGDEVKLTTNQTIAGIKTFSSFPVTPSSAPTTDYQTANKKYVDDVALGAGTVSSVFGRAGAVVATTNDYTWAQIDKTTSDIADITTKSHTSLTDIGTNTHAQIDTHLAGTNPHSGSATNGANTDITSLQNAALYIGRDVDNRLNWTTDDQLDITIGGITSSIVSISTGIGDNDKLVTQGYVDDILAGAGAVTSVFGRIGAVVSATNDYTWAQVDKTTSDIADITTKSHTSLSDIGSNSHTQIDSHISAGNPHASSAASGLNTDIIRLRNTSLSVGRDVDNELSWSTDDTLKFVIGGITNNITSISTGTVNNTKLVTQGYVDDAITGSVGLTEIVQDTSPQLGGGLDLNGYSISGAFADDFIKLSSITSSATELNYTDGVTSNIQTQLNNKVGKTGNETIAGIKTFSSFPITPSSAPTTDYQTANKKYVDDIALGAGAVTSVFGRSGIVTAQSNDYTWAQINKTTSSIADITTKNHSDLSGVGTNTHTQIDSHISSTSNPHSVTAVQLGAVTLSGTQTITGSKTFTAIPTSSNLPTSSGHVANKAYVDSQVAGAGGINNIVEDTTPQLGGNLDIQTYNIEGADAADFVKLAALTATSTELNYVDGVTSNIQTQLNNKEGTLGNPVANGYILSSTTVGSRSWVPKTTGAFGGVAGTVYMGAGYPYPTQSEITGVLGSAASYDTGTTFVLRIGSAPSSLTNELFLAIAMGSFGWRWIMMASDVLNPYI